MRRGSSVRVIEMLAYPAVQLLDVTGPLQVFATANEQIVEAGGTPPYALRVVAQRSRACDGVLRIGDCNGAAAAWWKRAGHADGRGWPGC